MRATHYVALLVIAVLAAVHANGARTNDDVDSDAASFALLEHAAEIELGAVEHDTLIAPGAYFMHGDTVFFKSVLRGEYLSVNGYELFGDSRIKGEYEEFRLFRFGDVPVDPARYISPDLSHEAVLRFDAELAIYCVHSGRWLHVVTLDNGNTALSPSARTHELAALGKRAAFRLVHNRAPDDDHTNDHQNHHHHISHRHHNVPFDVINSPYNDRVAIQSMATSQLAQITSTQVPRTDIVVKVDFSASASSSAGGSDAESMTQDLTARSHWEMHPRQVSLGDPSKVSALSPQCAFHIVPGYRPSD